MAAEGERFGFTVKVVDQVEPAPRGRLLRGRVPPAITPNTRVVAFTHVTSTVGDLLPAKELCALARERGALSLVDGAQSFGVLDVDLSRDPAGLLQRQCAQVAVRSEGERDSLRERPRAVAHQAVDRQPLSG